MMRLLCNWGFHISYGKNGTSRDTRARGQELAEQRGWTMRTDRTRLPIFAVRVVVNPCRSPCPSRWPFDIPVGIEFVIERPLAGLEHLGDLAAGLALNLKGLAHDFTFGAAQHIRQRQPALLMASQSRLAACAISSSPLRAAPAGRRLLVTASQTARASHRRLLWKSMRWTAFSNSRTLPSKGQLCRCCTSSGSSEAMPA